MSRTNQEGKTQDIRQLLAAVSAPCTRGSSGREFFLQGLSCNHFPPVSPRGLRHLFNFDDFF